MRIVWLIFGLALTALVGTWLWQPQPQPAPVAATATTSPTAPVVAVAAYRPAAPTGFASAQVAARADSVVRFALAQQGTPYVWAGTSPAVGFDCSGFLFYVYNHFGVATPHSTALLIGVGRPVPRAEARPGDLLVFTGTARTSATPGHAGIVVSAQGETPVRFVHASSASKTPYVKVSELENTDYERRFMQVRRIL